MSVTNVTEKKSVSNGQKRNTNIVRLILEGRAFFALIVIIAVFSFLSPYYFSLNNFLIMASHVAIFGILAIGMLLVILNGGIDLSVGSTLGLAGCIAGFLMQGVTLSYFGVILYPPVWAVVVLTCALGAVVGLMMWMWLSIIVVLVGAELNSEIEHQTAIDSTAGSPRPLGARGAVVADTVGPAKAA